MKKNYSIYLFIISSFFLLASCGGSDDELSEDIDVNLTASNLTDKGYFDGMLYYQIISNSPQEVSVSKATDNAITVQIPTQVKIDGKLYRCTNIGENAFEYCTKLTSLKISSSVTSIGDYAFNSCIGLTSVSIPNNVTSVGEGAFYGCIGLTSASLSNQLESISNAMFSGCTKIKSIIIPESVKYIGYDAFHRCEELESVSFPNELFFIDRDAFSYCNNLESLTIPHVYIIGDGCFENCNCLRTVSIKGNSALIGASAFQNCSNLTDITFSPHLIGEYALLGCTSLKTIHLDSPPMPFCYANIASVNGMTFQSGEINHKRNITKRITEGNLRLGTNDFNYDTELYDNFTLIDSEVLSKTILYVPERYLEQYRSESVWKDFANIVDESFQNSDDVLSVSLSKIVFPYEGGSATITINSNREWEFSTKEWDNGNNSKYNAATPFWLNLSQASGKAGQTEITITARRTVEKRSCELTIICGNRKHVIYVEQEPSTATKATCAEVIAGPDSKNYRVTGVCTRIANTNYGNWYLQDETGEIYIYGTLDANGKYNWTSLNIDLGDVVTVEGPKATYNGTVQLVDVAVINVEKSLVTILEGTTNAFDSNGGNFTVSLSVSGDGPFIDIEEDARQWLSITSTVKNGTTTDVTFHVAENTSQQSRTAKIKFTSTSGSSTSTVTATVSQMGKMGTRAYPFTVEQAIAYCQTLDGTSANDYYIKGTVSRIAKNGAFGSYGNGTFWISDDGIFLGEDDKNPDKAHDFEAYRVLYFGNEKWNADVNKGNISVGDEVVICGKLTLYNGISETASGNAYIYSINGTSTDANGLGSAAYPFNIAGAIAAIDGGVTANVFVKGIISEIANNGLFGAQYGNGTFWISDDGVRHNDPALDFEAYRVLWLGNRKWQEGDDQIAIGDEVILHGQLTKYGTTYETSSGKAYIFSLNGKTE